MTTLLKNNLLDTDELCIQAERAEVVTWQGHKALRLENGLALIPNYQITDARIEVMVGVDGPAYPGIAFRLADVLNFELAYPVPHVSGFWDALQYDPVFHGSNTWQLYHGSAFQSSTQVCTGNWFRLKLEIYGHRLAVSVDGQPPLVVERLAHPASAGMVGLWTYLPAFFRTLRISTCDGENIPRGERPAYDDEIIKAWFLEGFGVVQCEPNGVVNLNRCLRNSSPAARLSRRFEMSAAGEIDFDLGFSDMLALELDGEEVFSGENKFKGFTDRASRGYAELGAHSLQCWLEAGQHRLSAMLSSSEPFGWGLTCAVYGGGLRWLPAELG